MIVDTGFQVSIAFVRDGMTISGNGSQVDDSTFLRSANYTPLSISDREHPLFIVLVQSMPRSAFIIQSGIILRQNQSRFNVMGMFSMIFVYWLNTQAYAITIICVLHPDV